MKIAVNTRFLLRDNLEGIGWFTYETMKRITRDHPEHQFLFFFDRPYGEEFLFSDNIEPHIIRPPARHPLLWYIWFEYCIPHWLKKTGADAFISTDGYLSLSTDVKSLLVIHDLAFEHYPLHLPVLVRKYFRYYTPKYAHRADRIATVSSISKVDIHETYHIEKDKIDVVFDGANEAYKPLNEAEKQQVREEYTEGNPYFIYVGSIHPRKNVDNLLRAFDAFKKHHPSNIKLVIAGRKAWKMKETEQVYNSMEFKDEVIFTGHTKIEVLSRLMGGALSLVYPSFLEGFGIPVLEAIYCKVPVITSRLSSMPEVAGDAGILVDPVSVNEITEAMIKMAGDPALRSGFISHCDEQQERFSWNKTANALWSSFEKMMQTGQV